MNLSLQIATSKYLVPLYVGVVYYIANRYGLLKEESNLDIEPFHIVVIAMLVYVAIEVVQYFSRSISANEISLRPMD